MKTVAAALLLLVAGCNRGSQAPQAASPPQPVILGAEDVYKARVQQILTGNLISGELEARETATLRAQLAGAVSQFEARPGQRVKKGVVLVRIRALAEREAVASAQAAVRTAETALAAAERDVERTETLVKAGALAERDLEQARTQAANNAAQVAEAQARLAAARETLGESVIRAPISGVVSTSTVNNGDVVGVGAELLTIVDPSTLELRASVPADNLSIVRVGTPVTFEVQGYRNRPFRGQVSRIVPAADPATRQVDIYASLANDSGILVAGLYAQGRIATGDPSAVVVPADAVFDRKTQFFVRKVHEKRVVEQQISVGERDPRTGVVQVTAGVAEGDLVLVGAAKDIKPGAEVQIQD